MVEEFLADFLAVVILGAMLGVVWRVVVGLSRLPVKLLGRFGVGNEPPPAWALLAPVLVALLVLVVVLAVLVA